MSTQLTYEDGVRDCVEVILAEVYKYESSTKSCDQARANSLSRVAATVTVKLLLKQGEAQCK